MPDSIDRILASLAARGAACEAFVALGPRTWQAPAAPRHGGLTIIVSPSCRVRGGWRVTWLDHRGPGGHTELADYAAAVRFAAREYGVDLGRVEVAA